ncbi:transcription factor A, mitochondrial [Lethenteron reissneri]|uniref:transcription factor A, mitochondrial n=1 Tax=Lethenteron reissneri TaxID=7753 RepID=UPI002AB647B4|nr:transcription factor A, mitochondrial [Lethenteron reissneri]
MQLLRSLAAVLSRPVFSRPQVSCMAVRLISGPSAVPSPTPPKRPLTSFFRFLAEQRPQTTLQYPEMKHTEIIKNLSEQWRKMSDIHKERYQEIAKAEMQQYQDEYQRFLSRLSPEQIKARKDASKKKRTRRLARIRKKELIALGKPKRPSVPFNIFMAENFKRVTGSSQPEKLIRLRDEWSGLDDMQKQKYQQLAEDDRVRYTREMAAWREQMREEGRGDLVDVRAARKKLTATKRAATKGKAKAKPKAKGKPKAAAKTEDKLATSMAIKKSLPLKKSSSQTEREL